MSTPSPRDAYASPADEYGSVQKVEDILGHISGKGVRLWAENGELRYRAPKGVLTHEELANLAIFRSRIVSLLQKSAHAQQLETAPLAYSQLAHWHLYRLDERPAIRQLATALRLRGCLSLAALQTSLSEVVRRHSALRTRVIIVDGDPQQKILPSDDVMLDVRNLDSLEQSSREVEVRQQIEQFILEPVDVAADPLFGVRLLKLDDDQHVLIIVMEHMISDEASMNVLLRELFTAYTQVMQARAICLPAVGIQFIEYAMRQRQAHAAWVQEHGAYWRERPDANHRLRFPEKRSLHDAARGERGTVLVQIGRSLKMELQEWCRLRRTTLVLSVLTAYVALVLRWCNVSKGVIQYQSDGRFRPEMQNSVGYFATTLYLCTELQANDDFVDLLRRVTQEYCGAYEHADHSYAAAQRPRPEFTRNTVFNWIPCESSIDLPLLDGSKDAVERSPVAFVHPLLRKSDVDLEPAILLYEGKEEIVGHVYFALDRFSQETMASFGRNLLVFLETLLRQPEKRVKELPLS